jgi:hypothetical protein
MVTNQLNLLVIVSFRLKIGIGIKTKHVVESRRFWYVSPKTKHHLQLIFGDWCTFWVSGIDLGLKYIFGIEIDHLRKSIQRPVLKRVSIVPGWYGWCQDFFEYLQDA